MAEKTTDVREFDPLGSDLVDSVVGTVGQNISARRSGNDRSLADPRAVGEDGSMYKSMVENSPTAIILTDTKLDITYLNPAMRKSLERIADHLPVSI